MDDDEEAGGQLEEDEDDLPLAVREGELALGGDEDTAVAAAAATAAAGLKAEFHIDVRGLQKDEEEDGPGERAPLPPLLPGPPPPGPLESPEDRLIARKSKKEIFKILEGHFFIPKISTKMYSNIPRKGIVHWSV